MCGAFAGLDKVIQDRSDKSSIGFSAKVQTEATKKNLGETLEGVEPEDLVTCLSQSLWVVYLFWRRSMS